jgi:hypothetical protein
MSEKNPLTLRLADQVLSDFAAIDCDLQFIMAQFARIPTRKEQARNALGIIFATAMLTILAVLWFTGFWRIACDERPALSWLPEGSRRAARLRRPRRSFQHAMADHRRGETEGPLGTQGVRPLGVPPSDEVEGARIGWQVFDPATDELAARAAERLRRRGLRWVDRHHPVPLAEEPRGIFEFVSPLGADEEYILSVARGHKARTAAV